MTSTTDTTATAHDEERRGRKRAFLALGALLGVGALATSAYFTDSALLDLNGGGGFGSTDNKYNIQVSTGMENTVSNVKTWVEAFPDSAAIADIPGASNLLPGGSVVVKIPVLNESKNWKSTLKLSLKNTTPTASTPDQVARNAAYMKLLSVDVAETADASTVPTTWAKTGLTIPAETGSSSTAVDLSTLDPKAGTVLYLKLTLKEGATQAATDAANGGAVAIQAVIDGTSKIKD